MNASTPVTRSLKVLTTSQPDYTYLGLHNLNLISAYSLYEGLELARHPLSP